MKLLGFDIARRRVTRPPTPPLSPHPVEALLATRAGHDAAFLCPVDQVVMLNGFGFGNQNWHPFSATLSDQGHGRRIEYTASILCRFYGCWKPANAGEAIVGFARPPQCLLTARPHGYHFTPWSQLPMEQEFEQIERYQSADCLEHGHGSFSIERDGFKYHGPVSPSLGLAEYDRLWSIHRSLSQRGYDRNFGDVNVYMLRRGKETRWVCRGGVHRVAAMKALGHPSVPARYCRPCLVDIQECDHWPQVAGGMWDLTTAVRYFHHLFDVDAGTWARSHGLMP